MANAFLPLLPRQKLRQQEGASDREERTASRRLALWQLEHSLQCSVIGTCLTDQDLLAAMRKNRLVIEPDARSYDIHSHCVRAASHDCALSRSLNKLLERRFAGAVRLMTRAAIPADIEALWARLRDSGQIAAGYWATMSHTHIPASIKTRVFGEVHMLSHLNGHGASQLAMRLAEVQRRCAELETRLRRSDSAKLHALAERDALDAKLAAVATARPTPAPSAQASPPCNDGLSRLPAKLAKCERALIAARARARQAEAEVNRLQASRHLVRHLPVDLAPRSVAQPAAPALTRRRILYLGGRTAIVPHLRKSAEERVVSFLHHDGGIDDSLHRIEEMIEGCDAVVCPIDCVSHGACRMAKAICQRLNRRFVPIPTASRTGFERALDQLAAGPPAPEERSAAP
jgi:hypothetical protein